MHRRNFVVSVGSDYESICREIEEEHEFFSTFSREDFLMNGLETANSIDPLAIYNIASDPVIILDFVNKHTGVRTRNQKTNSNEIYKMLVDWVNGLTAEKYTVSRGRMYELRRRYFRYVCMKLVPYGYTLFDYEEFSKWLRRKGG